MLEFLSIKGFAIIDEMSLPFYAGLTVLTGETGAGKSIIVDALQTVLGEKVDTSVVRSGSESAVVEAAFRARGVNLPEGVEAPDGELVIGREIRREGRGRTVINGMMASLSSLREVGEETVDLHGQHEHQSLLRTANHLLALDSFASLLDQRRKFAGLYGELSRVRSQIASAQQGKKDRLARQDYLQFVVGELEGAALSVDEEQRLREEEKVLSAVEKLQGAAERALEEIYQGEGSAADRARSNVSSLKALLGTDSRLGDMVALLEGASAQMEEAGHMLRDYIGMVQTDPQRLQEIGERLALVSSLKKKYGPTVDDVLRFLEAARGELDLIQDGESGLAALGERETRLAEETGSLAGVMSRKRSESALDFEARVQKELGDLAMEKVRFAVQMSRVQMSESGSDGVEFLISPNPGEPLMPLRKIASGGELSRVMLALKRVLAGADFVPTLVFDEVDAGIGGRTAAVLGRKLKDIARHHQVLCVTHLAPVAAYADRHILVEKVQAGERTVVRARYLEEEERVSELARMMGGIELSSGIMRSARELLEEARG
ncbi:MAG: DNA repair protein RecN [bacterium]|nr:MAG: DNA repair protein RecN [bacterium]